MVNLIKFLKQRSLIAGILLMFLLTWPIDLAKSGVIPVQVPFAVYILLGWGFIFASLLMTGLTQGRGAVIALLKRFLIWRVGWKWYLVAFLLFPCIDIVAIALNAALTQTSIDPGSVVAYQIFGPTLDLGLLVLPFFLFDAVTNGEEMGWRGYILPKLQSKHSALVASLIVGVLWGLWHFPKLLAPGNTTPFLFTMLEFIIKAVLYTWLYNNTRGSLLLVTIFHAAENTAGMLLPITNFSVGSSLNALSLMLLLKGIAAVAVLMLEGSRRLSHTDFLPIQI